MNDNGINEDTIPVGKLVEIEGLESEAGKKLNGGRGFIFKKPSLVNGNLRYPVKLYALVSSDKNALPDEEVVQTASQGNLESQQAIQDALRGALEAPTKSVKASNLKVLEEQKQELFKGATYKKLGLVSQSGSTLRIEALPW